MSEELLSGMSLVATVGELRDLCERLATGFAELNRQNGALRNRLSDYECPNCEDSRDVCLCDEEDLAEDDCDHSILYCQKCGSLMLRGWCPTCKPPEVLVEMVPRAESDVRIAELEAELAERKRNEMAAIREMAKARRERMDAQSRGDLNAWLVHDFEEEREGLAKRLWDKSKELDARNRKLETELTELKGLFQRTHGCDVSWPREADRLKSELSVVTQLVRNLVARLDRDGGQKQQGESLAASATRADEEISSLHTELAKLRSDTGLEAEVRRVLKERIDSLSPRRETPWWHATWLSTQPGLYGTAVNRAQGATLFDLMREILKKESGE